LKSITRTFCALLMVLLFAWPVWASSAESTAGSSFEEATSSGGSSATEVSTDVSTEASTETTPEEAPAGDGEQETAAETQEAPAEEAPAEEAKGPSEESPSTKGKAHLVAEYLSYNYEQKIVIATGTVVLKYQEINLQADYMEVDLNNNSLIARGNVKLHDKERDAEGDELIYDLDTRSGVINGMSGSFTDPGIVGSVYMTGESVSIAENQYIMTSASLTTCDRENPHYRIEADEIEIYLNDKIVMHRVRYFEGKFHLFSLPYLVISLKEDEEGLQVPEFGYSATEGFFVKAAYGYVINENHSGNVRIEMMNRLGMATGIDHKLRIGENFTGTIGIYQLLNRQNTHVDWRFTLGAEQKIGKVKVNVSGILNHLATATREDYNTYQLRGSLSGQGSFGTLSLSSDYRFNENTEQTYLTASGNTNLKWTGGYSLSVLGSFKLLKAPKSGTEEFTTTRLADYTIRGAKTWDFASLTVLLEEKANLDAVEGSTTWKALVRQPEITLLFPKVPVPLLGDFKFGLGFSRYIEQPSEVVSTRTHAEIEKLALNLNKGGFNLALGGKVRGNYYGTGEYLFTETASLTWNQRYLPWLRTTAALSWTAAQGETPFTFDKPTIGASITGGVYVEHKVIQASLTSGYDFKYQRYRDIAARIRVNFDSKDYLQFSGSYSLALQKFSLFTLEGNLDYDFLKLKAKVIYDPNDNVFKQTDLTAALKLFQTWTLEGYINYNIELDTLRQASVGITYDWHCREIKLSYDFSSQAFRFDFVFKAFPDKKIGFGS
jgi:lipopolysaccharide assembly outer membrane protein LptD (OstA)